MATKKPVDMLAPAGAGWLAAPTTRRREGTDCYVRLTYKFN